MNVVGRFMCYSIILPNVEVMLKVFLLYYEGSND